MGMSRKEALKRVRGFAKRIEEHLVKLESNASDPASAHWRHEIRNWIGQSRDALPDLGKRTAAEWARRPSEWERRAEG
jgi:hypothetical protein